MDTSTMAQAIEVQQIALATSPVDGSTDDALGCESKAKRSNLGSIGDFIFLDADGYGKQTGNKGTFEVTMELIQDEEVNATIVIKEDWLYTFDKLPVGEYTVQVDNMHDGSVKVNLGTNQDCVGVDFEFFRRQGYTWSHRGIDPEQESHATIVTEEDEFYT